MFQEIGRIAGQEKRDSDRGPQAARIQKQGRKPDPAGRPNRHKNALRIRE
jgi:hypothetical protein